MKPLEKKEWGMQLAKAAVEAGLAVTEAVGGAQTPIPLSMNPMLVSEAELCRCRHLTHQLMCAGLKMAYFLREGTPPERIWKALSPLEKKLTHPNPPPLLATTRVDYWPAQGKLQALELNATIPAMQAYSDIAAAQTIAAHGRRLNLSAHNINKLQEANGSNTRALWEGLLQAYAAYRPRQQPRRLGILCRRNDAQLTELRYVKRAFESWGLETALLHPEQLENKEGFWANGKHHDLVYRHLFVHRLEDKQEGYPLLEKRLAQPNGPKASSLVFNPPCAPVEVKATFALLSESVENEALAAKAKLNPEERAAIAQLLPWTRLLDEKSTLEQVKQEPERHVLKQNWSYGGKAVFVGKARFEPEFAQRCQQAFGEPLSWETLCERAFETREKNSYVVQQFVETLPQPHLLCMPTDVSSHSLYVDFSMFSSVGTQTLPSWGGVCRGSASRVVNILGGGGLVPLLRKEVAAQLHLEDFGGAYGLFL